MDLHQLTQQQNKREYGAFLWFAALGGVVFVWWCCGCVSQQRHAAKQPLVKTSTTPIHTVKKAPARRSVPEKRVAVASNRPVPVRVVKAPGQSVVPERGVRRAVRKRVAMIPPRRRATKAVKRPKTDSIFEFPLTDLQCRGCQLSLIAMMKKYPGVGKVYVNKRGMMSVHFAKKLTSPNQIMGRATSTPIECVYEKQRKMANRIKWPKGSDVKIISKRQPKAKRLRVNFARHVVRGKVTIFDFYADWCGPCKSLDQWMVQRLKKNKKLAIRKVNIEHWGDNVAKRFFKRCKGLPYLVIYNRKGKRSSVIAGFDPDELQQAIRKAM